MCVLCYSGPDPGDGRNGQISGRFRQYLKKKCMLNAVNTAHDNRISPTPRRARTFKAVKLEISGRCICALTMPHCALSIVAHSSLQCSKLYTRVARGRVCGPRSAIRPVDRAGKEGNRHLLCKCNRGSPGLAALLPPPPGSWGFASKLRQRNRRLALRLLGGSHGSCAFSCRSFGRGTARQRFLTPW